MFGGAADDLSCVFKKEYRLFDYEHHDGLNGPVKKSVQQRS